MGCKHTIWCATETNETHGMRQITTTNANAGNDGVLLDNSIIQKGCKIPDLLPRHIADVVPLLISNADGLLVVVISMVPHQRDSLSKQ